MVARLAHALQRAAVTLEAERFAALRIVDGVPATTGVVIATYEPAEPASIM